MSYNGFVFLAFVFGLALRWALFELFERKSDADSFLRLLLSYRIQQDPRTTQILIVYLLFVIGLGYFAIH